MVVARKARLDVQRVARLAEREAAREPARRRRAPAGCRGRSRSSRRRSAGGSAAGRRRPCSRAPPRAFRSLNASEAISVCSGTLPGSRRLGCFGSSEKYAPRFCSTTPVSADGDAGAEHAVEAEDQRRGVAFASTAATYTVSPVRLPCEGTLSHGRARCRIDQRAALVGIGLRNQVLDRHVGEARIGRASGRGRGRRSASPAPADARDRGRGRAPSSSGSIRFSISSTVKPCVGGGVS